MIGHAFKVHGDDRVFVLTYEGKTRVWDAGDQVLGMSITDSLNRLGSEFVQADRDQEAWGQALVRMSEVVWPYPYTQELRDVFRVSS